MRDNRIGVCFVWVALVRLVMALFALRGVAKGGWGITEAAGIVGGVDVMKLSVWV